MQAKYKDNLLLTTDTLWVINGAWQLEKDGDVFLHPLTRKSIDIQLVGYIEYDGDYNSTLEKFKNGEGTHLSDKKDTQPIDTFCKKKYYGIECSCSNCKR